MVDARHAGGAIRVSTGTLLDARVVDVAIPGATPVPLFADEARHLAVALIEAAAAAERKAGKR